MKKLTFERIGNCVMTVCGLVIAGAIAAANVAAADDLIGYNGAYAGYGDAVNAIMNSDMWSSDKRSAIAAMDKNANKEIYKAVIAIATNDSMWSSDKVNAIYALFGK